MFVASRSIGAGALYVAASQRFVGAGYVVQLQSTWLSALIAQHELTVASPCGNCITLARASSFGSVSSILKSAVRVAAQRVCPFGSLICMLPERSSRKRMFDFGRFASKDAS